MIVKLSSSNILIRKSVTAKQRLGGDVIGKLGHKYYTMFYHETLPSMKSKNFGSGGGIAQWLAFELPNPAAPGSIPGVVDVAEVY